MADFVNFEAAEDSNIDEINVDEQNMSENISDVDFIDDENDFEENVEDYYAFANVNRSVEDNMQDFFIDFDYSQEANNYCPDDCDRSKEINDKFKDSAKKIEDFKHTLLILQDFDNIDTFYYALYSAIQCHLNNKKIECQNNEELKKDRNNDILYDAISAVKEKLRRKKLRINAFQSMIC